MASTYSTSLRLELMATGDQSGTWGDTTNTNLGTLLEQAITGVLSVAQGDAELTLTALDGAVDQSRNAVVNLTGAMTSAQNVIVPDANKLYLIKNSTTGGFAVTVKTSAGTGVAVPAGTARWVYADGTNVVDGLNGPWTPSTNDGAALGLSATAWSDLFLASGAVVNFNASNFTLTHSAGLLTANGTLASTGSSVGYTAFQAISTEAAAAAGPIIELYRNSASPAANDIIGQVLFNGEDSAGNTQEYGSIEAVIVDPTSTSEDSSVDHYAMIAGTRTRIASMGPSLVGRGTATNDSAAAGFIGEYIESTVLAGSAVSLTTLTAANVTSISLTAGDWDVHGNVIFQSGSGTTTTLQVAAINTVSATLPTLPNGGAYGSVNNTTARTNDFSAMIAGMKRLSLATTTTVYLITRADFAVSTMSAYGFIGARRVR